MITKQKSLPPTILATIIILILMQFVQSMFVVHHHVKFLLVHHLQVSTHNLNLQEEQCMASVKGGDDNPQEANHGNSSIDKLCIAAEEVSASPGHTLEDRDGCGQREGEEGQDDGHWECLELLKYIQSSCYLSTQGSKDTKHGKSAVCNLWDGASKPAHIRLSLYDWKLR